MFVTGIGFVLGSVVFGLGFMWGHLKGYEDAEKLEQQYQEAVRNVQGNRASMGAVRKG